MPEIPTPRRDMLPLDALPVRSHDRAVAAAQRELARKGIGEQHGEEWLAPRHDAFMSVFEDPSGACGTISDLAVGGACCRPFADLLEADEVDWMRLSSCAGWAPVVRGIRWRRGRCRALIAPRHTPIVVTSMRTYAPRDDRFLTGLPRIERVDFGIDHEGDAKAVLDDLVDIPAAIGGSPVDASTPQPFEISKPMAVSRAQRSDIKQRDTSNRPAAASAKCFWKAGRCEISSAAPLTAGSSSQPAHIQPNF